MGPHGLEQVGRLFKVGLVMAVRVKAEIVQRCRQYFRLGIEKGGATVGELGGDFRIENQAPGIDLVVFTEPLPHHFPVVADACRAPHVDDRVCIVRTMGRRIAHDVLVHVC